MVRKSDSRNNHGSCRFCGWIKNMNDFLKKDEGKSRWLMQNKHFFALLERYPKVTGHTLVFSKRHADDITELNSNEAKSLGIFLVKTAKLLKESLGAPKVYIMTMCEHWEPEEIDPKWKKGQKMPRTTEHLHFHLLPRYNKMRTKEIAQENMFTRPHDYGCTLEMLDLVRKMIRRKIRSRNNVVQM